MGANGDDASPSRTALSRKPPKYRVLPIPHTESIDLGRFQWNAKGSIKTTADAAMQAFTDSSDALGDDLALRTRFEREGYLYLRGIVDREKLADLRREIVAICVQHGWIDDGPDPLRARTCHRPVVEGEADYFGVYDQIQHLESFHALAHDPAILATMRALLGPSAFPHPLSICRLVFPANTEWTTPPHQDFPNNQGTTELYASWLPLGDCPQALGPLAILRGSHKLGLLPLKFALGAGHRQCAMDARHARLPWVSGDMAAGDMLIFHSLTVHRALPNLTDCMRLSVDYRFQREGEPLTAQSLQPHFQRLAWEAIYREWRDPSLKYYWRRKTYALASWDASLHELAPEDWDDAVRQRMAYDRRIAARSKPGTTPGSAASAAD